MSYRFKAVVSALVLALGTVAGTHALAQTTAAAPPNPQTVPDERSLTLNFQDVDIRVFIAAVSELTHRNFVVDPRVQGRITVISAAPTDPDDLY